MFGHEHGQRRSALADKFVEVWSWGFVRANLVQTLAAVALQDGSADEAIAKLASFGSRGQYFWQCSVRPCSSL
eukprot:9223670-Alexandrium_andersonii.AAC.1